MSSQSNQGAKPVGKLAERKVLVFAAIWTLMSWAGAGMLDRLGALGALDNWIIDGLASISSPPPLRDDIVLVAIDPQSFQDMGQIWPWPRRVHADLLEAVGRAGARAVVFDIVFDAETPDDARFANAISGFGPVVLAAERSRVTSPYGVIETEVYPAPALRDVATGVGFASLALDEDGRLRRMPDDGDALAFVAARAFGGADRGPDDGRFATFQAGAFPARVSYYQALAPDTRLPEGVFNDKVLIVGLALPASPTGGSTGDTVVLPGYVAGPSIQPGVVAQAHLLSAALDGTALRAAPSGLGVALAVFAIFASGGVLALMSRSANRGAAFAALLLVLVFGVAWLLRQAGWVLAPTGITIGLALAALGQLLIIGGAALAARRRLAAGFVRYVSPDIMDQILRAPDPPQLGGQMRDVSVIVTDLEGFTSMMDGQDADTSAQVLRDYLDTLGEVILDHGGMIDQFIGDSVVALFNAPLEQHDHATRALGCLVDLDGAAEAFRMARLAEGTEFGRTRIGAACGSAMVGNFGSRRRFHYTAIGDVVNTASRLESANREQGTRALVSEALHTKAGAPPGFRPLGDLLLRGKSAPIRVLAFDPEPAIER
jgi:adenylate cyclase